MTDGAVEGGRFRVFMAQTVDVPPPEAAEGVTIERWFAGMTRVFPPPARDPVFVAFWGWHQLGLFANREYSAMIVRTGGVAAHRSMVYPRYFAFPFMGADDIQVGNTFTNESYRGRGFAVLALRAAAHACRAPGRRLWYVAHETNHASCAVAVRAGLRFVGGATRHSRLGLRALGGFQLTEQSASGR